MHVPVGVIALLICVAVDLGGSAREAPEVKYADDRVSVRAEQIEVGDVLAALATASGAEVVGSPVAHQVTADFERVPLTDALQRLLGEQNFTVRYGRGGTLKAIVLRGGPEAPAAAPAPPSTVVVAAGPTSTSVPPKILLPHRFADHRPLPIPDRLAEVVGEKTATFDQIFDMATTDEDGVVRALAMQSALSALERERSLRRSLFLSLRRGDDGTLGAFLQTPRALEMLEFMAAHSREPSVQKKATVLLDQLRPPPPVGAGGG